MDLVPIVDLLTNRLPNTTEPSRAAYNSPSFQWNNHPS